MKPGGDTSRPAEAAFSLVEMLVVTLVLGIVALAAVPGITGSLNDARLNTAAAAVVDALEFARLSAMASGQSTLVSNGVASGRITVQQRRVVGISNLTDTAQATLSAGNVEQEAWALMGHPLDRGKKYDLDVNGGSQYGGARIVTSAFGSNQTVQFNAYGVPTSSGLVAVAVGNRTATVYLAAQGGRVTVTK